MKQSKLIKEIVQIRNEKGLISLYAYFRRNLIAYRTEVLEFGLNTNKGARDAKKQFLSESPLNFHYHSVMVRSSRSGWSYNRLRGIKIVLDDMPFIDATKNSDRPLKKDLNTLKKLCKNG